MGPVNSPGPDSLSGCTKVIRIPLRLQTSSSIMPNTGERGEIPGRVNAREAEVVQQSKKLSTKTRQVSARLDAKNRLRSANALKERPQNLRRTP